MATQTPTDTLSDTSASTISEVVGTPALTQDPDSSITEFGRAVALSDTVAIVVAEGHGAHVFEADNGWTETTGLTPDDGKNFGSYNVSAALVGNRALVGGPDAGTEPDTGAVYLFEQVGDEWTQRHRFRPDTSEDRDEFGKSIAFDGNRVVVGDVHDPGTMVPWTGGAYVFEGNGTNWTQEANLGTDAADLFGTSVAVDGDTVLVGAPYAEPDNKQTGAVYTYERAESEWQRQTMLSPEEDSLFGRSVAIDGETAIVGAPGAKGGSVYVFERTESDWVQQARVTAPDDGADAGFGKSVALARGIAVSGAPEAYGTGRAYAIRVADDWSVFKRLVGADPHEDAEFGSAVALSDTTALIGSPVFNAVSGAYLFDL